METLLHIHHYTRRDWKNHNKGKISTSMMLSNNKKERDREMIEIRKGE